MRIRVIDLDCEDHGRDRSLAKEGYALVTRPGARSRSVLLHRLVYCRSNGLELADIAGKVVRHTCDNPRCINPAHLLIGTRADNNRDRADRGRSAKRVPSRQKLTATDCAAIVKRYNPQRVGIKAPDGVVQLARDYGVDTNVIYRVLGGTYP